MSWTEKLDDTPRRRDYVRELAEVFSTSPRQTEEKLADFALYVPNNAVARFLVRYELMNLVLDVQGSIIECGVGAGAGLMGFAHMSTILEPYNEHRSIVGFDTFTGFPSISEIDHKGTSQNMVVGAYAHDSESEILRCAEIHDGFRPLRRAPQVQLIRGDITETVPKYVDDHPELVVGLCYLDCDLYEPTKVALEVLVPRMPKGSVVAFDELGLSEFPGETQALVETVGISNLRICRFAFTKISYAILE